MKMLRDLYAAFFRIGLFTFGGGYAMLPMLQREVVDKHHWITEEEILDCYAIGQCTPGVIAVNTATYVGYTQGKTAGAIAATLGEITPSIIIITIIAAVLQNLMEYEIVVHAFAGIRVAVAALVLIAVIKLFKKGVHGAWAFCVFAAVFLLSVFCGVSPIVIVAAAILLGVGKACFQKKEAKQE
jgi:chromate transporter